MHKKVVKKEVPIKLDYNESSEFIIVFLQFVYFTRHHKLILQQSLCVKTAKNLAYKNSKIAYVSLANNIIVFCYLLYNNLLFKNIYKSAYLRSNIFQVVEVPFNLTYLHSLQDLNISSIYIANNVSIYLTPFTWLILSSE